MADDAPKAPEMPETAGENAASKPRRRRPAPTIDLSATEVPEAAPSGDTPTREFIAAAEGKTAAGSHGWLTSSHLLAGLAGGGLVALVLFAMWLSGLVPIRYAGSTAMRARVTGLEMQVQDLVSKPAANSKVLDEAKERLGKIEQALSNVPASDPAAAERAAAAENAMKALGVSLAALTRRADEIAANTVAGRDEIAALQKRLELLETAAKSTQEKVAASSNADNAARLVLAAMALRDAVTRGEPYGSQLAVIRSLGTDAKYLAPLEAFAATGVPNDATLSRELTTLLPTLSAAAGSSTAAPAGFLDRLQANAGKLVRVRPVDEPAGDDASAVLARLEVKAARQDVSGAQADIARLPAKPRALAEPWSRRAEGRKAALAAAAAISADAARSLSSPAKSP